MYYLIWYAKHQICKNNHGSNNNNDDDEDDDSNSKKNNKQTKTCSNQVGYKKRYANNMYGAAWVC